MATQSGINILAGFQVSAYSPIDTRYLDFSNTIPAPYASTSSAINANPYYRHQGLTVLIGSQSNPQEYWWQNGTSDSDLVIKQKIGGLVQYSYKSYFPTIGSPNILYIDQSTNLAYYWSSTLATYSCTVDIFTSNPTVYLGPSYSFGKYINGMEIPAIGKTPQQVILDAISQPLNPVVNISVVPSIVPYNTKHIMATVSISYNIKSSGATATSGIVSYASASNPYIQIGSKKGTTASYSETFTYSFDYPALTQIVSNFKYDVIDTSGSETKPTVTINMTPYANPTFTLYGVRATQSTGTGESDFFREKGNVNTVLTSNSITINSPLVPLSYYQLFYSNSNGVSYTNIGSTISISSGAINTITSINNLDGPGYFKLIVTDLQQSTTIPSGIIGPINFYHPYFYYRSTTKPTAQQLIDGITNNTNVNGSVIHKVIANTIGLNINNQIPISGLSSPNNEFLCVIFPVELVYITNIKNTADTQVITGKFTEYSNNITTNWWSTTYYIYISGSTTNSDATDGYKFY